MVSPFPSGVNLSATDGWFLRGRVIESIHPNCIDNQTNGFHIRGRSQRVDLGETVKGIHLISSGGMNGRISYDFST